MVSTNAEANFLVFHFIFLEEQYKAVSDKMRYWNIYILIGEMRGTSGSKQNSH